MLYPFLIDLVIELLFICAVGWTVWRTPQIVIAIIGIAASAEETVQVIVKFMLKTAPERFTAETIAILIVRPCRIRLNVKALIALIGTGDRRHRIAETMA